MRNEFTALVERDGPWYLAYSPERGVPATARREMVVVG